MYVTQLDTPHKILADRSGFAGRGAQKKKKSFTRALLTDEKKKVELSKTSSILEQSQTEKQQVNHICTNVEGKSFIVWIFRPWKKKKSS